MGSHCITGIGAVCIQDVPPFTLVAGNKAITHGINVRGLRRRNFTTTDVSELKKAYKMIYRSGLTTSNAVKEIEKNAWESEHVTTLVNFFNDSKRGVIR